jgi:hypothetical protein
MEDKKKKEIIYSDITDLDVKHLKESIRDSDIIELELATGMNYIDAIDETMRKTIDEYSFSARVDGELACLAGAVQHPDDEKLGVCWCVGTEVLSKNIVRYAKDTIAACDVMLERWDYITNMVHSRQVRTIKWLELCGFSFFNELIISNERFCQFVKYSNKVK